MPLKWTEEEDRVLLQTKADWDLTGKPYTSEFRQRIKVLLPHRNDAAIQCRFSLLKKPTSGKRWSGYAASNFQLHPTDAAWLAGIFDGEGCIMISPKRKNGGLYLAYGNDQGIIQRVRTLVPQARVGVARKAGATYRGITTNHDVYKVYLYTYRAMYEVLKQLLPYLVHSIKRRKVIDYITYCESRFGKRS